MTDTKYISDFLSTFGGGGGGVVNKITANVKGGAGNKVRAAGPSRFGGPGGRATVRAAGPSRGTKGPSKKANMGGRKR